QTDLFYLTKLYEQIEEKFKQRRGAGLIYKDRAHAVRFIRDYFSDEVDEVWCDNRGVLKEISEFMSVLMPEAKKSLRLYEGDVPMFIKFGVEDQIESVFGREVQLPSGGSIVIDQTEALVAIDVNSGRVKGQDIEETALKANLEAAVEVARQVKIRDLGGLIVVDFIDMRERKHIKQVEQALRTAFAEDKSKVKFGRISLFGLMELSRQRLRKSLASSITRRCEACDGTGHIRAPQSAALSLLRRIEEACLRGDVKYIRATTAVSVANLLHNRRRRDLVELSQKVDAIVEIVGHTEMPANLVAFDVVVMKGGKAPPQRLYQLLDLIRNVVVRKESSPLPRPEDGLEALELDHNAIYRAIAQRDALLREQERDEHDPDLVPAEPDLSEDDSPAAADARTRRPRRQDRGKRDGDRRDGHRHDHAKGHAAGHDHDEADGHEHGDAADETAEAAPGTDGEATTPPAAGEARPVPPPPTREGGETPVQAERRRRGFMDWMRRIFGKDDQTDSEDSPASLGPIGPITAERIEAATRGRTSPAPASPAASSGNTPGAAPTAASGARTVLPGERLSRRDAGGPSGGQDPAKNRPPPIPKKAVEPDDDDDDESDSFEDDDDATSTAGRTAEGADGRRKKRRRKRRRTGDRADGAAAGTAAAPAGEGAPRADVPPEAPDGGDDDGDDDGPEAAADGEDGAAGVGPDGKRRRRSRRRRRPGDRPAAPAGGEPPAST
ncbi:MAG: ribonuclease E/G, partial [Myxococcales bacterium]|nr:ribonuclease E/G [Myxococcales bacterium]